MYVKGRRLKHGTKGHWLATTKTHEHTQRFGIIDTSSGFYPKRRHKHVVKQHPIKPALRCYIRKKMENPTKQNTQRVIRTFKQTK